MVTRRADGGVGGALAAGDEVGRVNRRVHRRTQAASNVPALSSVIVSIAYRPSSARIVAGRRPVDGDRRIPGWRTGTDDVRLTGFREVSLGDPRRVGAAHEVDEVGVVHGGDRIGAEVGRIDDRRPARPARPSRSRSPRARLLVAGLADAEPVAAVGGVAAMALGPHHRHPQRIAHGDPTYGHPRHADRRDRSCHTRARATAAAPSASPCLRPRVR